MSRRIGRTSLSSSRNQSPLRFSDFTAKSARRQSTHGSGRVCLGRRAVGAANSATAPSPELVSATTHQGYRSDNTRLRSESYAPSLIISPSAAPTIAPKDVSCLKTEMGNYQPSGQAKISRVCVGLGRTKAPGSFCLYSSRLRCRTLAAATCQSIPEEVCSWSHKSGEDSPFFLGVFLSPAPRKSARLHGS